MTDTALFTEAEARAYASGKLADAETYTAAAITAKEAEIRQFFLQTCGVNFFPTTHTDEYHDGDNTAMLLLDWPKPTSITAASIRSSGTSTWTALTASELSLLQIAGDTGLVYREGSYWPDGVRNIKFTYVAGHASVPGDVKDAALRIAVTDMPESAASFVADSFDAGGASVSWTRGDGYNGNWHSIPEVSRVIRLYGYKTGIV